MCIYQCLLMNPLMNVLSFCLGGSPEGIKCFGQGDRPSSGEGRKNYYYTKFMFV